jgi:hypothetical protein
VEYGQELGLRSLSFWGDLEDKSLDIMPGREVLDNLCGTRVKNSSEEAIHNVIQRRRKILVLQGAGELLANFYV